MINQIKSNKKLSAYLSHNIEDAGMQIEVDNALLEDEYIGIKLDDYYMGLKLGGETPKAVDFIVAVDCECDSYALYILELKNVKSAQQFTTKDIHLSYKAFYFYGMRLFIDREIPPNPVIKKIV